MRSINVTSSEGLTSISLVNQTIAHEERCFRMIREFVRSIMTQIGIIKTSECSQ